MRKLEDLMGDAIGHRDVLLAARAQMAFQHWPVAVGEVLADKVFPDRFERGVLFVTSESSVWAQEVVLQRKMIIARLNELCGENLFKDIKHSRGFKRAVTNIKNAESDNTQ